MSRILAYTSPARGHLYPLTPILLELKSRGQEIAVRTLSNSTALMAEQGFDAAPIDPRIEQLEHDDWQAKNPRKALERSVALFARRAEFESTELNALLASDAPDFLFVDINCFGALAAAEAWGGPWAAFCPYPLPLRSKDAPPFGPGLKPANGPIGRARDRLISPLVLGVLDKAMRPALNDARKLNDLDPLSSADEAFRRPPLLLSMTAEPFEYPRSDWPESVLFVGACAWEPPAEPPNWLAQISHPIVLVTTSSEFQNDGHLVETAFAALADEDVEVVATVPAGDAQRFDPPPNGRVVSFTPHGPILQRAACAITHGGMGATQKALASGVPVCAVPFGRDQLEVARRVTNAGAGTMLPARRLNPERLRRAVTEAQSMTAGASRVAAGYQLTGGAKTAADAIELWLN